MKYILMMNTMRAGQGMPQWAQERHSGTFAFMIGSNKELRESGELVSAEGLAFPDQAKLVRAGKDGVPITDGVFPESKEFLAGYWIVDVETPERAYAIAAQASAAPGTGGAPMNMPIEVRPGHERAATRIAVRELRCQRLGPLPSICCANSRRRCSARSPPFPRFLLGGGRRAGGHDCGIHAMAARKVSRKILAAG